MADNETTPNHPHAVTLELIFRQGQRVLGELGQIRDKQDEIIVRLVRVEREVVDLRRVSACTRTTSVCRAGSTASIAGSAGSSVAST